MSPFLNDPVMRALFDVTEGGPPRAWECRTCGRVCKRLQDMQAHLRLKHDWKEQIELEIPRAEPTKFELEGSRTGGEIPDSGSENYKPNSESLPSNGVSTPRPNGSGKDR